MANGNYYLGQNPEGTLGNTPRFFYGLRKSENGSLYFQRSDQIKGEESIEVNLPGEEIDNFNDFESGVDFFEGVDVNHSVVFKNLKYPQYRWDNRSILYYINDNGELIAKINQGHTYQDGVSE